MTGQNARTSENHHRYLIRQATDADLDAIADFEVTIARVSFGTAAITDAAFHRRRVAGALGKPGETMLVAVAAGGEAQPAGWAWLSARTNSLTGERYGNFRSLAVAEVPGRGTIAELLMTAILDGAAEAGLSHLQGKVHAANLRMRSLYRAFGFTATHITMEKRTGPAGQDRDGVAGGPVAGAPDADDPGPGTRDRGHRP